MAVPTQAPASATPHGPRLLGCAKYQTPTTRLCGFRQVLLLWGTREVKPGSSARHGRVLVRTCPHTGEPHGPWVCALQAARLAAYWQGGLVGVFSLTAGTLICSLGCWPGLSELAGACAGLGPPGVWSGAGAVVTTCCCMSFCCTTWAVAVTAGIICTCCPAAVACVSVTVCGEACAESQRAPISTAHAAAGRRPHAGLRSLAGQKQRKHCCPASGRKGQAGPGCGVDHTET